MRIAEVLIPVLAVILLSGCVQPEKGPRISEHQVMEKWAPDGVIGENEYFRSMLLLGSKSSGYSGGNLEIFWKNDADYLYMALKGNTTGWISVGFEPQEWMKNADIIMAAVDGGKVTVQDQYCTGNYGPHVLDADLGGTYNILEHGGMEQNGQTVVEFKRRMNTGDRFDKAFVSGQKISIIWAMANTDQDQEKHNVAKGEGIIELQSDSAVATSAATLSEREKQGIIFIREEEKAARDLYISFYGQTNLSIFQNVASSEQSHMDSVKVLIDKYGLKDPVQEQEGAITNQSLKALYLDLLEKGGKSPEESLRSAAVFEEISILDLQREISAGSQEEAKSVFQGLLAGSLKHLRSFVNALKEKGASYSPRHLSQKEYEEVMR